MDDHAADRLILQEEPLNLEKLAAGLRTGAAVSPHMTLALTAKGALRLARRIEAGAPKPVAAPVTDYPITLPGERRPEVVCENVSLVPAILGCWVAVILLIPVAVWWLS